MEVVAAVLGVGGSDGAGTASSVAVSKGISVLAMHWRCSERYAMLRLHNCPPHHHTPLPSPFKAAPSHNGPKYFGCLTSTSSPPPVPPMPLLCHSISRAVHFQRRAETADPNGDVDNQSGLCCYPRAGRFSGVFFSFFEKNPPTLINLPRGWCEAGERG